MKKLGLFFLFIFFLIVFGINSSEYASVGPTFKSHPVPQEVFSGNNATILTPNLPIQTYDPAQSIDLSTLDDFEDPDWDVVKSGGNCEEIEVDISELEGVDIPLDLITDNNTVILSACEE